MRVIVIGAGVVGACVSYQLAQAGVQVTTVDSGQPAGGTSSKSFAWLNAFSKTPWSYFDLNFTGMREHRALMAELDGDWCHFHGNLSWADTETEWAAILGHVARLREWGYAVDLLKPHQVAEIEPELQFGAAESVVYTPDEGWCEVTPLIAACLGAAKRRYGAIQRFNTQVTGFRRSGDRLTGVELQGDRGLDLIEADQVVLCAGHLTDDVAAQAGIHLPHDRVPGFLAYTEPVSASLKALCHHPRVHFRPDGGGRLIFGLNYYDQLVDTMPADQIAATLQATVAQVLPAVAHAKIEAIRYGVRPMPKDGLPMVGALPGLDNGYVVISHSGVTLGPLWGKIVASELTTGALDPRLADYRPDRYAGAVNQTSTLTYSRRDVNPFPIDPHP